MLFVSSSVGGLAGNATTVTRSYATGIVSGSNGYTAGFVAGYAGSGPDPIDPLTHTASFWNIDSNPELTDDRWGNDYPGVFAETTVNMQTQTTFTNQGWDFVGETTNGTDDYWMMPAGGGYPILNPPPNP